MDSVTESGGVGRRLRLAVVSERSTVEDWQARSVQRVVRLDGVELVLVVSGSAEERPQSTWGAAGRSVRSWLWHRYYQSYVCRRSRAKQPVNLSTVIPPPAAFYRLSGESHDEEGSASMWRVDELRRADLDVILHLGTATLPSELSAASRQGVWRFSVEVDESQSGAPPCFWEMYGMQAVTECSLERVTVNPGQRAVLQRAATKVLGHSYVRTLDSMYYAAATLPARACKDLLAGNVVEVEAQPDSTSSSGRRAPGPGQTLRFAALSIFRALCSFWQFVLFEDRWRIGVVSHPIHAFLQRHYQPSVQWLEQRHDSFLADPFGVDRGGRITILAERFHPATNNAEIVALQGHPGGPFSGPRVVLDPGVHIAYPFLVVHDDEVYCIPETGSTAEVALYRASSFPSRWEKVAALVSDFVAVDSTVFFRAGRWWLFCTGRPVDDDVSAKTHKGGVDSMLFVWHAPSLLGPWSPHALNPVKIDVRSSRPGGTPFCYEGELYRPAQDCARTYGGSVVLNRITDLTPASFAEEPVSTVESPDSRAYGAGLHTLSAVGDRTLIDAKRLELAPRAIPRKLAFTARRLARHVS